MGFKTYASFIEAKY